MKLMVTGSRDWEDWEEIKRTLSEAVQSHGVDTVVHGGAAGADSMAGWVAKNMGLEVEVYKAQWTGPDGQFDKAAGYKRNIRMLEGAKPDLVVAFWDGKSRGTKHALDHARRRRIPVRVVMANEIEHSVREAAASEVRVSHIEPERASGRPPPAASPRERPNVDVSPPAPRARSTDLVSMPAGRDSVLFALSTEERSALRDERAVIDDQLEDLRPQDQRWSELTARRRRIEVALAKDEFARAVELRDQGVDPYERPPFEGMSEEMLMNLPANSDAHVEGVREMRRAERAALLREVAEQDMAKEQRQERVARLKEMDMGEPVNEVAR